MFFFFSAIILPNRESPSFKRPPLKRARTAEDNELRRKMDSAFNSLQSLQPKKDKHLCDIYGELVAAKLKAMDESTREICMHRIDNILFEMKMMQGPATSTNNTHFMPHLQSSSTSSSSMNSPSPAESITLYAVSNDSNEYQALSGNVVVCSDTENGEHPPTVENYFSQFK